MFFANLFSLGWAKLKVLSLKFEVEAGLETMDSRLKT